MKFSLKDDLMNMSENPSLSIFDCKEKTVECLDAEGLFDGFGSVKVFGFKKANSLNLSRPVETRVYEGSDDIPHNAAEVTLLSGAGIKNLLSKYPYRSKYVLACVSLSNVLSIVGVLGLIRRYFLGKRFVNGKITIKKTIWDIRQPFSLFILIENRNSKVTTHFSISSKLGYKAFLDKLNNEESNYVVLRFFDKLPNKHRDGGDLDIMVSDSVFSDSADFLQNNSGSEMVDMYSVTGPASAAQIPYYTPHLARKLLIEYELHNGYRVPSKINYLNSLIYHCLYHKGLSSGIPTKYEELKVSETPDNDYLMHITELAKELNLTVGNSLEELDDYMKSSGWRPHFDTLELICPTNRWLHRHLSSEVLEPEITLTACVLKKGFFDKHSIESFRQDLNEQGFRVLYEENLVGDREQMAGDHLRGGNWSSTNNRSYFPKHILFLFDASIDAVISRKSSGYYNPRAKKLALRRKYDVDHESHIHMTDSTHQTMEYVDVLCPEKKQEFINSVDDYDADLEMPSLINQKLIALKLSVAKFSASLLSSFKKTIAFFI